MISNYLERLSFAFVSIVEGIEKNQRSYSELTKYLE